MSFSVDANVLLYASDTGSPLHAAARRFLKRRATGREIFYLAWPTAMAYLRIATHTGVFAAPLTPAAALDNLRRLVSRPHVRPLGEARGFLDAYAEVTGSEPTRGNLVPDAHLATILYQHGVRRLYSNDGDFRRFDFLELRNPFTEGEEAAAAEEGTAPE